MPIVTKLSEFVGQVFEILSAVEMLLYRLVVFGLAVYGLYVLVFRH